MQPPSPLSQGGLQRNLNARRVPSSAAGPDRRGQVASLLPDRNHAATCTRGRSLYTRTGARRERRSRDESPTVRDCTHGRTHASAVCAKPGNMHRNTRVYRSQDITRCSMRFLIRRGGSRHAEYFDFKSKTAYMCTHFEGDPLSTSWRLLFCNRRCVATHVGV